MRIQSPTHIELVAYEPTWLPAAALTEAQGEMIDRYFRPQLDIAPPSFQTGGRWRLTPRGWVGTIPLDARTVLAIRPRLAVDNLFRMLATAYDLDEFRLFEGRLPAQTLGDFYELVVLELLERVAWRLRQGLYQPYQTRRGLRPAVVGRLDIDYLAAHPAAAAPRCDFEIHTADIPANQILAWTLRLAGVSGLCAEPLRRRLWRVVRRLPVSLRPFSAADCEGLATNRLNEDYRSMYLLCRFILDLTGPEARAGSETILPFLVDMNRLFEKFVAAWLDRHLPDGIRLQAQERVFLDEADERAVRVDLILTDRRGRPLCVLDTKFKAPDRADLRDVFQVTFYAHARGCPHAFLVYPTPLARPLDGRNREVRYRSTCFALDGDLDAAGRSFLNSLLPLLPEER